MRYRDLTILDIGEKKLIFACDSSGGIGSKKGDTIKIDNESLGRFLAQVPFFEILAIGAKPSYVFLPIANEMETTGEEIIQGVKEIMAKAGLDPLAINGSTEENIPTLETGAGITVLALVDGSFSFPRALENDYVFALGLPKVGREVLEDRGEIMTLHNLKLLRELPFVGDILPVGSRGIGQEALDMARSHGLDIEFLIEGDLLTKSAGPSTVVLCSARARYREELSELGLPVNIVGRLYKKD